MNNILVSCISATTEIVNIPNYYPTAFTINNLRKLCKDINCSCGIPILNNFDSTKLIGTVIYGEVVNEQLKIIAKLLEDIPSVYIVPGYRVLDFDGTIYKNIELINMGLTLNPIDESVTNFQKIKW